tara:strand:- start:107 stop:919 length:813 start_codon:yes stop_codon:yes gene_type:complete
MKKLLGIVVLGLLLMNNAYPNTPSKKFVYEKLYNEYSTCTVYYKFLNRGVSLIKRELTDFEKKFMDETKAFSESAEMYTFFFAKKLNVSNEKVQKNIEKIYKSMLDQTGNDYSKADILNDQYALMCKESLADPKVRMVYWDNKYQENKDKKIKEMLSPSEKPKELKGVNLQCSDKLKVLTDEYATIHFATSRKAEFYKIENFEVVKEILTYKPEIDKIIFLKNFKEYFVLSRESLQSKSMRCQVVMIPAENLANFVLKKMIEKQKSKNKL